MKRITKTLGRRIFVLFLATVVFVGQIAFTGNFVTKAATTPFPEAKMYGFITIPPADIVPGVTSPGQTFKVTIQPDYTTLLAGFNGDGFDPVEIYIILPESTSLTNGFPAITVVEAPNVSTLSATITTVGTNQAIKLTITNIQNWVLLDIPAYTFSFACSNIFENWVTPKGKTEKVIMRYGTRNIDEATVTSTGGTINWRIINGFSTVSQTYTQAEVSGVLLGTTAPVITVNLPSSGTGEVGNGTITTTISPPSPQPSYNQRQAASVTVVQKITHPADITDVVISAQDLNGVTPVVVYDSATRTYTITWEDVPINGHTVGTDDLVTNVAISSYKYDPNSIFPGENLNGTYARDFTVTTTGAFSDSVGTITNSVATTNYKRIFIRNPFYKKDINRDINMTIDTEEVANGQRYVTCGFNCLEDSTWTFKDAIDDSTGLTYKTTGFSNDSGQTLYDYRIVQDLYIKDSGGIHETSYRKLYVEEINIGLTTRAAGNKAVTVVITLADDTTISLNRFEGDSINLLDGSTNTELAAYLALDTSGSGKGFIYDDEGKGNIKSVTFIYGNVANGFELLSGQANEVVAKVIPHYVKDEVAGEVYIWDDFALDWVSDNVKENFLAFNKEINNELDNRHFFGAAAYVMFKENASDTNYITGQDQDGLSGSPSNGVVYFNCIATSSTGKDVYNLTQDSAYLTQYENGDIVEFIITVKNNDNLGRNLNGVWITDIMDKSYIGGTFQDAVWEVYTQSDNPTIPKDLEGKDLFKIFGTSDNPSTLLIVDSSGIIDGTKFGTWDGTTLGNDPWTDTGDKLTNDWRWYGVLEPGDVLVVRFKVDLKFETDDQYEGIKNSFEVKARYSATGGGGGGGIDDPWYPISKGAVEQGLWPSEKYLDVKIVNFDNNNKTQKNITPGEDHKFVITALATDGIENDSAFVDMVVSAVLPYGWVYKGFTIEYYDIVSDTYVALHPTKYSFQQIAGETITSRAPALGGTNGDYATEPRTISSTLLRWTIEKQELRRIKNNASGHLPQYTKNKNDSEDLVSDIRIVLTATAPDVNIVKKFVGVIGVTGGYGDNFANYHDRIFASAALLEYQHGLDQAPTPLPSKEYRNDGWNLSSAIIDASYIGGHDNFGKIYYTTLLTNPLTNPAQSAQKAQKPTDVTYRYKGTPVTYDDDRLVIGKELDDFPVYGIKNWNGNAALTDRLNTFADVTYRNIYPRPGITISPIPTTASFNLDVDGEITYQFKIQVFNDLPDAYLDFEFSEVLFRHPEYFRAPDTIVLDTSSSPGSNYVASFAQAGEVSTITFTKSGSASTVVLKPGESIILTVTGKMDPAEVGPNGHGIDFSVTRLANYGYAFAAVIPVRRMNVDNIAPISGHGSAENPTWYGYNKFQDGTSATPFFRSGEESYANMRNRTGANYVVWNATSVPLRRSFISPNIKITAQYNGGTPEAPVWKDPSTAILNIGAEIRWTIGVTNFRNTSYPMQKAIEDGVIYIKLPENFIISSGTTVELSAAQWGTTLQAPIIDTSEPGYIILSNVYLDVGEERSIYIRTIIPPNLVTTECEAYLIPKARDYFVAGDVVASGSWVGSFRTKTQTTTALTPVAGKITTLGFVYNNSVRTAATINVPSGYRVGSYKRVNGIDTISKLNYNTSSATVIPNVGLGSTVNYTLEIRNANTDASSRMTGIVLVDALPRIGDDRNSEIPVFVYPDAADINFDTFDKLFKVYLVNAADAVTTVPAANYRLTVADSSASLTNVFNTGLATGFETLSDFAARTPEPTAAELAYIRFEYLVPLEIGTRIRIEVRAHVPDAEEMKELVGNPLDFNDTLAVNSYDYAATIDGNRVKFMSNVVNLRVLVSQVNIGAFIDLNRNGKYDTTDEPLWPDVEGSIVLWDVTAGGLVEAFSFSKYDDCFRDLYTLDPSHEYEVRFSEGVDVASNLYYWYLPYTGADVNFGDSPIFSVFNSQGKVTIAVGDFDYGEVINVFGGYKETGPLVQGYIWNDVNGNGVWDKPREVGLKNVKVVIYEVDVTNPLVPAYTKIGETLTDEFGYYCFDLIEPLTRGPRHGIDPETVLAIQVLKPNTKDKFSPRFNKGANPHSLMYDDINDLLASYTSPFLRNFSGADGYIYSVADFTVNTQTTGNVRYFYSPAHNLDVGIIVRNPNTGDAGKPLVWLLIGISGFLSALIVAVDKKRKLDLRQLKAK